ncbi:MAG: hypothetical protein ABSC76_00630 [Terracidiphilus sp.]|jgi:hypothetical protein
MNLLLAAKNAVAFVFCVLFGYIASTFLPEGAWFILAYMLITYHLFLVWLVMSADYETDLTLPIGSIALTHLICLTLVVSLGIGLRHVPYVGLIRYVVPALGVFEIKWLFRRGMKKKQVQVSAEKAAKAAATKAAAVAASATVDDYRDWLRYLALPNRPPRQPGMTVEDEYKQWLLARAKSRLAIHPKR